MTRMRVAFFSVAVLATITQAADMRRAEEVSNTVAGHLAKLQDRSYSVVTTRDYMLKLSTGEQSPYHHEQLTDFAIRGSFGYRVDLVTDKQRLQAAGLAKGNIDPWSEASWSYAAKAGDQPAVECRVSLGSPDHMQFRKETHVPYFVSAQSLLKRDPIGMLFLTHDGPAGHPIWGSQPKPDSSVYEVYLAGKCQYPHIVLGAETDATLEVDYKGFGKSPMYRFVLDKKRGLYPIKSTTFYPGSELPNTVTEVIAWGKHGDLEYPAQIKRTGFVVSKEKPGTVNQTDLVVVASIVDGSFSLKPPVDRAYYAEANWSDPTKIQQSTETRRANPLLDKVKARRAEAIAAGKIKPASISSTSAPAK